MSPKLKAKAIDVLRLIIESEPTRDSKPAPAPRRGPQPATQQNAREFVARLHAVNRQQQRNIA